MIPTKSTPYSSSSFNYYAALDDDSDADTHNEAYNDAVREQANHVATEHLQGKKLRTQRFRSLQPFPRGWR